jgi:hypothetical protein
VVHIHSLVHGVCDVATQVQKLPVFLIIPNEDMLPLVGIALPQRIWIGNPPANLAVVPLARVEVRIVRLHRLLKSIHIICTVCLPIDPMQVLHVALYAVILDPRRLNLKLCAVRV